MTEKDLLIQRLRNENERLKAENASLKEQFEQKWIPVSDDRKPKIRQKILVSYKTDCGLNYLSNFVYLGSFRTSVDDIVITAWQPEPMPYNPPQQQKVNTAFKEQVLRDFFKGAENV